MALERPLEVWQTAQQLQEAGPFDYYQLTAAQHTLLETTWQGLYPGKPYPCSTRSCPGRIREAHRQLLAELKYFILQNPDLAGSLVITPQSANVNTNPITAAAAVAKTTAAKPSSRYRFAKGVSEVREFGNPIPHTKVTDELVERLLGDSPDYARLFVDTEEEAATEAAHAAQIAAEDESQEGLGQEPGGKVIDLNKGKTGNQEKLATPSQVKQMNTADVKAQYLLEFSTEEAPVTEVPAELDTNAKVAAAIIARREQLADAE